MIELKRLNSLERRNVLFTGRGQEKSAFEEVISHRFLSLLQNINSLFLFYDTDF